MRAPDDLTEKAHYPTTEERGKVKEAFDPQQAAAAASGSTTVDPVTEPAKFRTEMKDCMDGYIGKVLPGAEERKASSVSLDLPMVQSMAEVAQKQVEKFFKPYLKAAVHSADEKKRLDKFKLKDEIHLVSEKHPEATLIACNWLSSRMADACGKKIGDFNVMASVAKAKDSCFPATPAVPPRRLRPLRLANAIKRCSKAFATTSSPRESQIWKLSSSFSRRLKRSASRTFRTRSSRRRKHRQHDDAARTLAGVRHDHSRDASRRRSRKVQRGDSRC